MLFDIAGNPGDVQFPDTPDKEVIMDVSAAGLTSIRLPFDITGKLPNGPPDWVQESFEFTANSSTTTLTFEGANEDDRFNGPTLDNVRVNLVRP